LLNEKRVIQVLNKADLNKGPIPKPSIAISCKNKAGLKELITFLSTSIHAFSNNKGVSVFGLNSRQLRLLTNIKKELEQAVLLSKQKDFVLYVSKINYVFTLFNTLISPSSKNEIINQIFKGFCVGK
jgi:tRNA U34 5-carboxymethylaminomethyl modifying GTPase MnmE/TrmE